MPETAVGVDHLTVAGMRPSDYVSLVAEAGCNSVSLFAEGHINPLGLPPWSLLTDAALRRDTKQRFKDTGVVFALGEGCGIGPDMDVGRCQPIIDAFCEMGVERVAAVSRELDSAREADQIAKLAEMTTASGVPLCIEFGRLRRRTLAPLAETVLALRPRNVGILIDAMHFFRGGETVENLARLDPSLFVYMQICDVPLRGEGDYMDEALNRRLPPGEGELPLADLVAALPEGITISMEIPQVALAKSGVPHLDRVRHAAARARACIEASRAIRAAGKAAGRGV